MTREEAIKLFKREQSLCMRENEWYKALYMAINDLEQKPCEDAISRQAVLKVVEREQNKGDALSEIEKLPPVNPQPKTGHWISDAIQGEIDGQIVKAFICSECGAISVFRITGGKIVNGDLCPNCGAKMVEPQETETWNGYHGQITAPKGTFERIFNDADDDSDI